MKLCLECKKLKLEEEFCKDSSSKDGLRYRCKQCDKNAREKFKLEGACIPKWKIRNDKNEKQCTMCKQWKKESEFPKGSAPDGLGYVCKICDATRAKEKRGDRKLYSYENYNELGEKQCIRCKQWKSTDNFNVCNTSKDKLSSWCKQCQHEYDMQRRPTEKSLPSYLMHKDGKKFCNNCKKWIDEKDFYKSRQAKDGLSSRCKFCQQDYDNANREKIRKRQREYKRKQAKESIMYRLSDAISTSIRDSLKRDKNNRHWETLVNYNIEQLKQHLESQFTPEMDWDNYGSYWEIDHIIPKNTFTYASYLDKEFQICWSLANLRPLSIVDNRSRPKNGSDISEDVRQEILNQTFSV